MFRSCRYRFGCFSQMKFTNLKLFQNESKIILVGTGIILSLGEIFSDLMDAKNCLHE